VEFDPIDAPPPESRQANPERPWIWVVVAFLILLQFAGELFGREDPALQGADSAVADSIGSPSDTYGPKLRPIVDELLKTKGPTRNPALRVAASIQFEFSLGNARKTVALQDEMAGGETGRQLTQLWEKIYGAKRFLPGEIPEAEKLLDKYDLPSVRKIARWALLERTGRGKLAAKERKAATAKDQSNKPWEATTVGLYLLAMAAGLALALGYAIYRLGFSFYPPDIPDKGAADGLGEVFILYLLASIGIAGAFVSIVSQLGGKSGIEAALDYQLLIAIAAFAVTLYYLRRVAHRVGLNLETIGWHLRDWKANVVWGICGAAVAVFAAVVGYFISIPLFYGLPQAPHPISQEIAQNGSWLKWIVIFFEASVVAPVTEELLFRGALFMGLWRRLGRFWPAAILSSVAFAIVHPQLFAGYLSIAGVGLVSCLLLRERRSLLACIVMHGTYNSLLLLLSFAAK
jgi:membrane protease YdiL (CAAX protease family)